MFESLKRALRQRALRRHASSVPTGIMPLGKIRKVAVFMDAGGMEAAECARAVRDWAASKGKDLSVYALALSKEAAAVEGAVNLTPSDLNFFGRVRRSKKVPAVDGNVDLLISLFDGDPFAVEFEAVSVGAAFKAGRVQLPGDVYDLVVNAPEGEKCTQEEAFREMVSLMEKIN
ncbi:MAG: hypothetical protein IJ799_03760 [Bacteroidales bacterium]|nr:hypothetical protein [Bacteroidales bacterium]